MAHEYSNIKLSRHVPQRPAESLFPRKAQRIEGDCPRPAQEKGDLP